MRAPNRIAVLRSSITVLIITASCPAATGIEELYRLDLLPRFKQSTAVASVSSYDRTGGNDDGFSGKYSYVRKEGDGLVIADLKGPGVIYRIWTPTPTDDITEFYFDGEDTPRIRLPFRELFTGKKDPFLSPVAGLGGGGFYSYVPLSYRKSCKVVVRAEKVRFYQINYAAYPASAGIETYPGSRPEAFRTGLDKARRLLARTGSDISANAAPPGAPLHTYRSTVKLQSGVPATVFAISKPGRLSPAGDFFGYAWGEPAVRSLLVGTAGDTNYTYFPMPFDSSARIELLAEGAAPRQEIHTEVVFAEAPRSAGEGKFHAIWRRENPTTAGKPFTFLDATGRGHLVGVILQAQGLESGRTPFFEGDDEHRFGGLFQRGLVQRARPLGPSLLASVERRARLQQSAGAYRGLPPLPHRRLRVSPQHPADHRAQPHREQDPHRLRCRDVLLRR